MQKRLLAGRGQMTDREENWGRRRRMPRSSVLPSVSRKQFDSSVDRLIMMDVQAHRRYMEKLDVNVNHINHNPIHLA